MASERKIGGSVYRCDKLPADEALKLFARVAKLFRIEPELMGSIAMANAERAAPAVFVSLVLQDQTDGESTHALMVDLAQTCFAGTDQCVVGVKPADLKDLVQVAWFAMEVNFKDFLSGSLAES
jgi:hypothetical protein